MKLFFLLALSILPQFLFSNATTDFRHGMPVPIKKGDPAYYRVIPVRTIKQADPNLHWVAAFAMMYSWKHNDNTIKMEDAVYVYGDKFQVLYESNSALPIVDERELIGKAKMVRLDGLNPTIDEWYKLLHKRGPLSITIRESQSVRTTEAPKHTLVISGLVGNDLNDAKIYFINPAVGLEETMPFQDFVKMYNGEANYKLQIVHWK